MPARHWHHPRGWAASAAAPKDWCGQCGRSDDTAARAVREVLNALGYDQHRIDYNGDGHWEVRVEGKHLCFVRGGGDD